MRVFGIPKRGRYMAPLHRWAVYDSAMRYIARQVPVSSHLVMDHKVGDPMYHTIAKVQDSIKDSIKERNN